MSVENQLEITATADVSQRVEKDVEIDVEGSFMQGKDSSAVENTLVEEVPETGGDRRAAVATSAIDWFKGLTPEEQAGAITFSDGAFLGTFLAFASPWSLATPTPSNNNGPGRDVGKSISYVVSAYIDSEIESRTPERGQTLFVFACVFVIVEDIFSVQ
jgi:hypothetical protein